MPEDTQEDTHSYPDNENAHAIAPGYLSLHRESCFHFMRMKTLTCSSASNCASPSGTPLPWPSSTCVTSCRAMHLRCSLFPPQSTCHITCTDGRPHSKSLGHGRRDAKTRDDA